MTGVKTKPVNWNIITDQNENPLVELLSLGFVIPPTFLW